VNPPVITPEALYRTYAGEVFRFALHLCGNRSEAEDITSETFVRVWSAGRPLRLLTVRAYLFKVAYNLFRRRWRTAPAPLEVAWEIADDAPLADEATAKKAQLRTVLRRMQALDPVDRAVLLMHAVHAIPYEQIAQALGISVAAAKVKTHRARKALAGLRGEE